jgi:GNAT superfamily N-acetyltransferase
MIVRLATVADLENLLPLVRGYREFYRQPHDAARERAFVEARLREGTSTIFVAEERGEIAGFVQLFQTYSTVRLTPALILEDLFVVESARGKGVASALLAAAEDRARTLGTAVMFLETAIDNAKAQAVYERAGWSREAQFYKYNAPL